MITFLNSFLLLMSLQTAVQTESTYTDLSSAKCTTIKVDQETGSSTSRCAGVGGYQLLVEDDDARQSVTIVAPDGRQHPLNYWEVITPAFSSVGEKAEWFTVRRDGKVTPVALIVRVNAQPGEGSTDKKASYLAVAKITTQSICVTDKMGPGPTANAEARRAAQVAGGKRCLAN